MHDLTYDRMLIVAKNPMKQELKELRERTGEWKILRAQE